MKRILTICLAVMLILNTVAGVSFATKAGNDRLYFDDFSNGITLGTIGTFGTGEVDGEHGISLKFNSTDTAAKIGPYDKNLADGRYLMSFEVYCSAYSDVQVFLLTQADSGLRTASNYLMYFKTDGTLEIHRNGSWMLDRSLSHSYVPERWYKVDIWLDTINREISFWVNGTEKARIEAPDAMTKFCGFAIRCEKTSNPVYLDNIMLVKENAEGCEGLSPIFVKAQPEAGIIGNNFYTDEPPVFDVAFTNRLNHDISAKVFWRAMTAEDDFYKNIPDAPKSVNKTVWQSEAQEIMLLAMGTKVKQVEIDKIYYGRMKLETVVEIDGKEYITETPYTMSRRTETMPVNKAVGVHSQNTNAGNGETDRYGGYEYTVPVLSRAGFGTYRNGNILNWRSAELTKGTLKFTDDMKSYINFLDGHDMDLIFLYSNTSQFYPDDEYNADWHPMSNQECLDAMVKYIGGLTQFAEGKLKAIEVWNEWFGSNNSLNEYNYDLFAKMHKLIYDEVNSKSDTVDVIGLDADWWCAIRDNNIENGLKAMQSGDYIPCMDGISVHPYNPERERPEYTWYTYYGETIKDKSTTKLLDEKLDTLLGKYGQNIYMPRYATENGWGDYDTGYDRGKQAAYTVRTFALTQAEKSIDVMCIHCDVQYADKVNNTESDLINGTMGILEAGTKDGTEIPYLGKPVYVATAFYNTLATNNRGVESLNLGDNIYGYNIHMEDGRQALMLGCIEGDDREVSVKLSEKVITLADMYGNERSLYSADGIYRITIGEEPVYLIGKKLSDAQLTSQVQNLGYPYAVVGGYAESLGTGLNVCIDVYNEGYTIEAVDASNIKNALYFRGQCLTDSSGHFGFTFPVELGEDETKKVYVRCGNEEVREYDLYQSGNAIYCVKRDEDSLGKHLMIDASIYGNHDEIPKLVCGIYEDGILKDISHLKLEYQSGGYLFFNMGQTIKSTESIKLFYFKNLTNIMPLGSAVSIY